MLSDQYFSEPFTDYFDVSLRNSSCDCFERSRCELGSLYGLVLVLEQDVTNTASISRRLVFRNLFIVLTCCFGLGFGLRVWLLFETS